MSKHNEYIQQITDRLVQQIKQNKAPWQRPFSSANFDGILPVNVDGRPYRGTNLVNLMSAQEAKGYQDTRWLTFLAAKKLGASVKKGEKGTTIHYWKFHEERYKRDDEGNKVLDDKGRAVKERVVLDRPRVFYATVFNAEQIDGLPDKQQTIRPIEEWERHERCERIVANSGVNIIHKPSDAAYYSPVNDHIVMPERSQFATADLYYATLLHEIGHSTGHETRLNRDLSGGFGSESYAREELRAEIASMMLGQELQIGHDPGQHIAYLESWSKIVKEDPNAIFLAVKDADAISKYVLSLDPVIEQEVTIDGIEKNKEADVDESSDVADTKTYLYVPYEEKDEAKSLGARWDKNNKSWYAPAGIDLSKFNKWLNEPTQSRRLPTISAEEEVAKFLESKGCVIKPGHPKLDGRFHRLHIKGDKNGSLNGSYVIHTDNGIPRGYFRNFKTGEEEKFVSQQRDSNVRTIANVDFDKIKAEAEAKTQAEYNEVSELATKLYRAAVPANINHNYLANKQITAEGGVMAVPSNEKLPESLKDKIVIGSDWREARDLRKNPEEQRIVLTQGDILLPVQNKDGDVRTVQTIAENGFKSYLKGGEKSGNFTAIGDIKNNEPFMIVEGWATGKTIHEQAGIPVIVAFDKSNLLAVAETMRENHPNNRIYIGADNDHIQEAKYIAEGRTGPGGELNPGIEAAKAAAEKINAHVLIPKFSAEDKGSDWNDIYVDKGLNEFKNQLREQVLNIKSDKNINFTNAHIKEDKALSSKQLQQKLINHPLLNSEQQAAVNTLVEYFKNSCKCDNTLASKLDAINTKIPDIASGQIDITASLNQVNKESNVTLER